MIGREVLIPKSEDTPATPAFAAIPDGAKRGVVVIHELFGRQPEIDRAVERLARAGYAAIAPDLFHRGRTACLIDIHRAMQRGSDHVAARQGRSARTWLVNETKLSPDKIGLLGFCWGGGYALATGSGWGAVSANYGAPPPLERLRGIGPVIACYGGRDRSLRKAPAVLEERLRALGAPHEVHVFDEAGHGFLTDGRHPILERINFFMALGDYPEARERGWSKILDFFERHLH